VRSRFIRLSLNIPLSVFIFLMVCCVGQAQSGRRAPKPLSPPTTTTPPKESEPPPAPKPTPKQQTLIAGIEMSLDVPFWMSDMVWNGFIERFNKVPSIVITANKDMNRKEASDRAKKATESTVVLLQITTQGAGGNMGQVDLEELSVNFTIYTQGTGKIREHGRVYIRPNRSVLGQRLPSGRSIELQMKEAGRETAERVLSLLHTGESNLPKGFVD
jgi:hypothetical protein